MSSSNDTGADRTGLGLQRSDLKQVLNELYSRRWIFVVCVILTTAGTAAWVYRQPKVYEAVTVIEYDPSPVRPLGSAVEVDSPMEAFWMSQEFYETQNRILASQSVAERTVQALGLHRDLDFLYGSSARGQRRRAVSVPTAARILRSRLKISLVRLTRLVEVKVEDTNPRRAARIANTLVSSHIEKTIEDRLDSALGALDWLQGQLVTVRGQLEGSELALHDFKQDNNILSVSLEDRQNMITNQLEGFTESVTDARARRIAAAARVTELRSATNADPLEAHAVAIDESIEVRGLRDRYHERDAQCHALAVRYGTEHPEIQACNRELASIRDAMREAIHGILQSAESTLREIQQTERGLNGALEQVNQAGLALNLREIDYARLLRERETNSKLYGILLDRTAETSLTRYLRVAFIRVVDEADAPTVATKPRKRLAVGLAVLGGLALGVVVMLIVRLLDRTLSGAEDLANLGLTVLGVVPQLESNSPVAPTPRRRRRQSPGAAGDRVGLEILRSPRSAFAECFRLIRTNVTFLAVGRPLKTLLVTSAGPGDGKTTVSINLCAAFAQNHMRVLLVDADLRRPNVHRALDLPNDRGVSTILVGEATLEECIHETEIPGLHVITAGAMPPNPSELLNGQPFAKLLEEMLPKYDRVVFDSPPVGVVADGLVIASVVSGTILVARPGLTHRDLLQQSLAQLKAADTRVLGCVVNAVKQRDLTYGSGSYHYTASGYYGAAPEHDSATTAP
jgi:succinoglycan biosynthesis transport protein ExoP